MDVIRMRRSVRQYRQDLPVQDEQLELLLSAAMQAPSAGNQRPWEFLIIRDPEILTELTGMSPYASMTAEASAAVIILANREHMRFPEFWQQDCSAAAENLLLEAVRLGLGAVWLGCAPIPERQQFLCDMFALPESVIPFCLIPVGIPEEGRGNRYIDRFLEERVHREIY